MRYFRSTDHTMPMAESSRIRLWREKYSMPIDDIAAKPKAPAGTDGAHRGFPAAVERRPYSGCRKTGNGGDNTAPPTGL